jgi:putative restriction endonuclease
MKGSKLHVIIKLTSLNQGTTPYGPAPHKPILLLAVIESFEAGGIYHNWIEITPDLLQRFYDIWNLLVKTQHVPNFSLPFYHLKNEKGNFWQLVTFNGQDIPTTKSKSIKSFRALTNTVAAARLSDDFYAVLTDPVQRENLKLAILEKYFNFPGYQAVKQETRYTVQLKSQILYEPEENYARKILKQYSELPVIEREEYVVLRSSVFRKAILEIYGNQCSVSRLKVEDASRNSLVDACHIMPFSTSYNDSIRNGLALSPTFHRAFDRGMIALSDDYRVLVHPKLKDHNPEAGIRQYENREILLPAEERFYPSVGRLREHRERFGFG